MILRVIVTSLLSLLWCGYAQALDVGGLLEEAGENRQEVEKLVQEAERRGYEEWSDFLFSSMPDVDLVNLKSDDFISHFDALKKNLQRVPWRGRIDDHLFYHYILPHRVSQEPLENFTALYVDTLYHLVAQAKNMREAVLRINEWVYTKMKYEPTARWDQNALVTMRRGFGRCEEMAILCIKALRTVCIPARKVYTPWWPFTNSNHAWVEVWADGKWHSVGGGEPGELDQAVTNTAPRTAIVKGVVYGEAEAGKETIYKKEKGFTIMNTTPNYTDVTELSVQVKEEGVPAESASVSICVYNYSSLPSVGLKKTDENGYVQFVVGKTDLFVYASKESLRGYDLWKPSAKEKDTVVIEIAEKEVPDTSFWIHTRRIEAGKKEPKYKPNRDSLKLLQTVQFSRINIADTSIISILDDRDQRLVTIFHNAKGGARSLLRFYKGLSEPLKEAFIDYFHSLHPKDIVSIDTIGLEEELRAVLKSRELAGKSVPDSILEESLLSDRVLFEQTGKWRKRVQPKFMDWRKGSPSEAVAAVFSWVEKNTTKVEEKGYFGPTKNPEDVWKAKRGTDVERYILAAGILRSIGIPARVKWSQDALEYWDKEWSEKSFGEKKEEGKKAWIALRFEEDGDDVTEKQRYYYDYSITTFEEYPERLDPPVDTCKGEIMVTLDEEPAYTITGWRNGYGDTWVRIKRVIPKADTARITIHTGIPEEVKPGDLVVRKYRGLEVKDLGIEKKELERGDVLIVVFDTDSEASRSTLKNAKDVINRFPGKVWLLASTEKRQRAEDFLREMGIRKGNIYTVSEDLYRKKWRIRDLPSVIRLRDGECILWVEGLFLHLSKLLDDVR